jgi:hypothetical protein
MGWIGTQQEIYGCLSARGADRDESGRYIVRGGIFLFMGVDDPILEAVVKRKFRCADPGHQDGRRIGDDKKTKTGKKRFKNKARGNREETGYVR